MSDFSSIHIQLSYFNRRRLKPQTPSEFWRDDVITDSHILISEGEMLEHELENIRLLVQNIPNDLSEFMRWFESLRQTGPGQNDPLFDWLAEEANIDQMRWFIKQEVAGEAGFEDLTALTQIKFPVKPKLEMARNFWDEMGRGTEKAMHGPMLGKVAKELQLEKSTIEEIVPESLALANILTAFAANRRYAYHSVGALGAIELTAPDRAAKVYRGLKRLGLSSEGQKYYSLHAAVDIRHSFEWNKEVILPILEENFSFSRFIAEGALLRLYAGARCFTRYRAHFGLTDLQ